jgi:hypothetical protein
LVTRKDVLWGLGAGLLAGFPLPAVTGPRNEDEAQAEKRDLDIAEIIRDYDRQGIHRTGTTVDRESGHWLAEQVRRRGATPEVERSPFRRLDVEASYVEIGGERVEALPIFDSSRIEGGVLKGRLGAAASDADIVVLRASPEGGGGSELEAARAHTKSKGIVVVTGGKPFGLPDGLTPINAPRYAEPYGPPVLQVASEAWGWLTDAAAKGSEAALVAHVQDEDVEVFNVAARVDGKDPNQAPIVVMTPRSGWWHCAAERGGGIATWLLLLESFAAEPALRPAFFIASTGHELGHWGLDRHLEKHGDRVQEAMLWFHLGANFGAAVGGEVLLQTSDAELESRTLAAMRTTGAKIDRRASGSRPVGEAQNIHDRGGRYVSLLGRSGLFHHRDDRWPTAVDVGKVRRFTDALILVAHELANA